jgi:hypothetical protein
MLRKPLNTYGDDINSMPYGNLVTIEDIWSSDIYQYEIIANHQKESQINKQSISLKDILQKWKSFFSNPIFTRVFGVSFNKNHHVWFTDVYNAVINTFVNDDGSLVDDIKKYMDNYNEFVDDIISTLPEQFREYKCKKTFGKNVCTIRTNEGKYINSSLNQIREVIKTILYEKNKDSISMTPLVIGNCLQHYCNYLDCFTMTRSQLQGKSDIFNVIQKELKKDLKEIVISVFCVLNLSEKANNPPPVPYINTNGVWYYINNISLQTDNIRKLKDELALLKNKIVQQFSNIPLTKKIGVSIDISQRTLDNFVNTVDTFEIKAPNDEIRNHIITMLNEIDKINAASAIGTLQFVDSLAKFNTTNVVCTKRTALSRPKNTYVTELEQLNLHDAVLANENKPAHPYKFNKQYGGKKPKLQIKKTTSTKRKH